MGLCVGTVREGRANGASRIPFTMDNGLVPGLGPFRAVVSGPLTDKGTGDLTRDWACDLSCDWSGDVPTVTCWERFLLRRSVRNSKGNRGRVRCLSKEEIVVDKGDMWR